MTIKVKCKIIKINPETHSISVRYYTEILTEKMLQGRTDYNLDLPIPVPVGQDLTNFIIKHAPIDWLTTKEAILNPTIDTSLSSLLGMEGVEVSQDSPTPNVVKKP